MSKINNVTQDVIIFKLKKTKIIKIKMVKSHSCEFTAIFATQVKQENRLYMQIVEHIKSSNKNN